MSPSSWLAVLIVCPFQAVGIVATGEHTQKTPDTANTAEGFLVGGSCPKFSPEMIEKLHRPGDRS
jgi:hypothetical protein